MTGFSMEAIVVLADAIKEHRNAGGKLKLVHMPAGVLIEMGSDLLQLLVEEFKSQTSQLQQPAETPTEFARRWSRP